MAIIQHASVFYTSHQYNGLSDKQCSAHYTVASKALVGTVL